MDAADGQFNRIRLMAPTCPPMWADWRHMANTNEFVLPSAHQNPQPNGKSIGSAVSAQLTAESPYTLQWAPISPKIAPSHGETGPHLTRHFLGPSEPTTETASRSVQPLLHRWPQCPYTLEWDGSSPSKLPILMGGSGNPLNTWFHGSMVPSPQLKRHLNRFSRFCRAH